MPNSNTKVETNPLTTAQFKFEIEAFPHVTYNAQTVILPSMQVDGVQMNSPRRDIPLTGTKLNFDPFALTFIVDDKLNNYTELYNWLIKNVTENFDRRTHMSDATLHILNGDLTPNQKIKFFDCFPTMIAELPFESNANDSDVMECSTFFNFSHFKLENTVDF